MYWMQWVGNEDNKKPGLLKYFTKCNDAESKVHYLPQKNDFSQRIFNEMHPIEPKRDSRVIKLTRLVNKLMNHILCMKNMVEFVFKGVGTIGIGEKCSIRMQSLENLCVYPPTPLTTQVMINTTTY